MTSLAAATKTAAARVRRIAHELGYAQRRMFEIQTGTRPNPRRPA